jgi:hypothetical protein
VERGLENAPSFGAEIWLSAIIGFICLMVGLNFAKYSLARLSGKPYHTGVNWVAGPNAGQEVAYPELQGFTMLTDSAYFLFGLALIFEAIMLAVVTRSARWGRALLMLALAVAVIATAYNLFVVVRLFAAGVLPIPSLLAVAFGGYIVASEWRMLQSMKTGRALSA